VVEVLEAIIVGEAVGDQSSWGERSVLSLPRFAHEVLTCGLPVMPLPCLSFSRSQSALGGVRQPTWYNTRPKSCNARHSYCLTRVIEFVALNSSTSPTSLSGTVSHPTTCWYRLGFIRTVLGYEQNTAVAFATIECAFGSD